MKKMTCEVCGSHSFKKENGVFICQECGTEYSLNEAKKLLVEIEDDETKIEKIEIANSKQMNDDSKISKLKLEYDLLCWHNFYEKCHELENSFEIKDDSYNCCSDISSDKYEGDIASRDVNFRSSNESYFSESIYPSIKNKYLSKYASKDELFPFYEKAKKVGDEVERYRVEGENAEISKRNVADKSTLLFLHIGWIIPVILAFVCLNDSLVIIPVFLFIVAIFVAIAAFFFTWLYFQTRKHISAKPFANYDDWIKDNIDNIPVFKDYVAKKKSEFLEIVDVQEKGIIESRKELAEIKNALTAQLGIPIKYTDEYHINALLALVLDCRADTLKEAINLYETESYRSTVVNSLKLLNYNIIHLNNNIMNLRNEVNNLTNTVCQGFNALIQQNNCIASQLDSMSFDTRYLMIDNLLS